MKRTTICLLTAVFQQLAAAQAPIDRQLSPAWTLEGRWTGVAADAESGSIYTLGYNRGAEVDLAGQVRREFPLPPGGGWTLRLGKFPSPTLLTFIPWVAPVTAYDLNGTRLWSYPKASGIDAVWTGNVDGDESDEVVVGYNGNGGVHVLDGHGRLRWKSTDIGNVWQVAVGDVLGRGRSQVVATSALGRVHVFGGDLNGRLDIDAAGVYLRMVRAQKLSADDAVSTIFAAGRDFRSKASTVMALATDGTIKWRQPLPSDVAAAEVASTRPWLALGTSDGHVFVVDAVRGEIVGVADMQGSAEVAWAGDPPLLLVATGASLNAFRVTTR
jgi:hypothetical protein